MVSTGGHGVTRGQIKSTEVTATWPGDTRSCPIALRAAPLSPSAAAGFDCWQRARSACSRSPATRQGTAIPAQRRLTTGQRLSPSGSGTTRPPHTAHCSSPRPVTGPAVRLRLRLRYKSRTVGHSWPQTALVPQLATARHSLTRSTVTVRQCRPQFVQTRCRAARSLRGHTLPRPTAHRPLTAPAAAAAEPRPRPFAEVTSHVTSPAGRRTSAARRAAPGTDSAALAASLFVVRCCKCFEVASAGGGRRCPTICTMPCLCRPDRSPSLAVR